VAETVLTTPDAYREAMAKALGNANEYETEISCFRNLPIGHPSKHIFALNCMRMQWGDWLVLEANGYDNYWFKRIVRVACRNRFVWAIGAASSGKSMGFAAYLDTAWKANAWCTSGIVSSTSRDALQQRAWGIMKKMHTLDRYKIGMRLDYKDAIVLQEDKNDKDRLMENSIIAVALPKGSEGEKAIGEIQGRKNHNVIWLCDELGHMDGNAIQTARGNLAANRSFQFFGCSNKPEEGDPMYQDAEPFGPGFEKGWDTPGLSERTSWPTRLGVCIYFDGDKSPNLKAPEDEPVPFPMLSTREYRKTLVSMDGIENGPQFWRWWKAFPKKGEINDRVLTVKIIEAFGANDQPIWGPNPDKKTVAGLDLGLKKDGDPCCSSFAIVGKSIDGQIILAEEEDAVALPQNMTSELPYEKQIAQRFIQECENRQCHLVALDISGGGGTMALAIREEAKLQGYNIEIIAVDFGGSPSEENYDRGDGTLVPAKELFDRKVTELWYSYRLAVQNRLIRGFNISSNVCKQFCERRVIQDEKRKFKVEKKEDMKKRIKRSPDHADARALCHVAARKAGLSPSRGMQDSTTSHEIDDWPDRPIQQRNSYGSQYQSRRSYAPR